MAFFVVIDNTIFCHHFVSIPEHFGENRPYSNLCQAKKTGFFQFISLGIVLEVLVPNSDTLFCQPLYQE